MQEEARQLRAKINDYENKLALMSSEIERLKAMLDQSKREIDEGRMRYSKLEMTLNESRLYE